MADENLTPQTGDAQGDARRTLKLRPAATNPAGGQLADPMHGDTDTSNLDVLDDTQTRKTIKIKPLNPTAPQINIGAIPQTQGATPLAGTQTRKSVVLKSSAAAGAGATPLSGTQTRKAVVISPAAAPGATPLAGTQTRKTVVLKPTAKPTVAVSEPAPETPSASAPEKAEAVEVPEVPVVTPANETDDTVTRKAAVITDNAAVEDDKTVKIARPKLNKPAAPDPKRTVKLSPVGASAPAAPPPVAKPAPAVIPEAAKPAPAVVPPAVKPAVPEPPAASEPAAKPTTAPVPPVPPVARAAAPAAEETVVPEPPKAALKESPLNVELTESTAAKPSVFYTVVAAITLLLLIAGAAFTAAQYLDFDHKVDIYNYIPGLPHANK